ncbi:tetratricopeptide repeat protein [Streptomyces sp. NPDC051172]|uniref:VMAP-C domain-containing protein n=1 Tax=Streptomyces sp. NPDC051172 TaxID=3155796 RepID=UPI00342ADB03
MTTTPPAPSVSLKPLVSWPRSVEDGRKYLVTVDVEFDTESSPWPYDTEEYEIGCMLEGGSRLTVESAGDTTLVLHRFGGTYGSARFVVYATREGPAGLQTELRLTLITAGGVPFRSERLAVRVGGAGVPAEDIEVPLPRETPVTGGTAQDRQPTGTVMVLTGSGLLAGALKGRLAHVERRTFGVRAQVEIGELRGTAWRVALVRSGSWSQRGTREVLHGMVHDLQVPLVVSVVQGRETWQTDYGDVVVATEVLQGPRSRPVRPSYRLVSAAREVLGSSVRFLATAADGENDDCLTTAYAVPAAEHFTVSAVGDAAADRAVEALVAVLEAVDPEADPLVLPPVVDELLGRDEELRGLLDLLDPAGAMVGMPNVSVVTGMPGIGKTALAVAAAHQALMRGWFPGGIRFLPGGCDAQEAQYHVVSWLQDRTDPALFVCDALDSWDWLTTVGDASLRARLHVLATSRRRPKEFSRTKTLLLDPLSAEAAVVVLDPDGSHPASASRLAELCGGVPLALRLARWFPPGLENLLARAEGPGGILEALDDLEQVYEAEYQSLPREQAQALRLLALIPGDDVGRAMADSVLGDTADRLEPLMEAGLVLRNEATRRWRLPALVRAYVEYLVQRDPVAQAERAEARGILGAFCTARTKEAVDRLGLSATKPGTEGRERMELPDALAWLDGERTNLTALALELPEPGGRPVSDLVLRLGIHLNWRGYFHDCMDCCNVALVQEESRRTQADLWNLLGAALSGADRPDEAVEAYRKAADLFTALGDEGGLAGSHNALAMVLAEQGDRHAARETHLGALDVFRSLGDRLGQADALISLGMLSLQGGEYGEAGDCLSEAARLYESVGSTFGMAHALVGHAEALCRTGAAEEAVNATARAQSVFATLTDTQGQARAWEVQAEAYEVQLRYQEARSTWHAAAETYARAGDEERAERARDRGRLLHRRPAREETRLLVTVATAPFRSSSVRWALHVSRGSGWAARGESTSPMGVTDLRAALQSALDEALRAEDPDRLEFALPLGHFDLEPHRWAAERGPGPQLLGTQLPVVLRDMARAGRPETAWLSRWRELRNAHRLSAQHIPIAGPATSFPVPPDRIPVLCGPAAHGRGRDLVSRLLKDGHGVILWTAAPHPKRCGPQCLRLRDEAAALLSDLGSLAELPQELWQLRTLGSDHRLSLLYDDPESPLPAARRPST